jgi:acetylglutamate synthase
MASIIYYSYDIIIYLISLIIPRTFDERVTGEYLLHGKRVFTMSEYENAADPSHQEYLEQMVKENQNKQVPFMERMSAAHDEVLAEFSKYWKQLVWNTPSMYQGFKEFIKEIDWSEKWIQSILAVQACILLTLILFRRNMAVQNTIFVTSGMSYLVLVGFGSFLPHFICNTTTMQWELFISLIV